MFDRLKLYWFNATIRKKLMMFIVTIILCVSIFSLYLLITTYSYMHSFNSSVNEYFKINVLQHNNTINDKLLTKYFSDSSLESLANYNNSIDAFYLSLTEIKNNPHNSDIAYLLDMIDTTFIEYCRETTLAIKKYRNGDNTFQIHRNNAYLLNEHLNSYLKQFLEISLREGSSVYSQLVADARFIMTLSSLLLICFLLGCLVFGFTLSNYLTNPIEHLAEMSKQMSEGNLNIEPTMIASHDEVGILAKSFNAMSNNIRKLIADLQEKSRIEKRLHIEELKNIKNQELLKEARFLALQSQINPHFLFNTLNTVSRVITLSRPEEGIKLISALSDILRYNMGNSQLHVSLLDELKIVKQYIHIQHYRFGDRIKLDIDCLNIEAETITIPRFTLQPIIENAVIHGLEPKIKGGSLRIKAYLENKNVIIKITDNGVGIEKEKVKAILAQKNKDMIKRTKSIGLANVINRLIIFSDNPDCFTIKSKLGLGTIAIINIPMKRYKNV